MVRWIYRLDFETVRDEGTDQLIRAFRFQYWQFSDLSTNFLLAHFSLLV